MPSVQKLSYFRQGPVITLGPKNTISMEISNKIANQFCVVVKGTPRFRPNQQKERNRHIKSVALLCCCRHRLRHSIGEMYSFFKSKVHELSITQSLIFTSSYLITHSLLHPRISHSLTHPLNATLVHKFIHSYSYS